MPRKRDIREKALQALFAISPENTSISEDDRFWSLCLEPEELKLSKLSVKALKHQLQSLVKLNELLSEHAVNQSAILKTYEHKAEARQLLSLTKATDDFTASFSALGNLTDGEELDSFFLKAKSLEASLSSFITNLKNTVYENEHRETLETTLEKLKALSSRVDYVASPLDHKDQTTISALIKSAEENHLLKSATSTLAQTILDSVETLDQYIDAGLTNFSGQQIGKVERNLLRIATYEICIQGEPKAVAINEALELAKKYATDQAVPLINGMLDTLSSAEN